MANAETAELRLPVLVESDVVGVRREVRTAALAQSFDLVRQTKIVTAASEIARNTVVHGGGGEVVISSAINGTSRGLKLVFTDRGPGIPDQGQALTEGWSSGTGLGLGLSGSRRLVNEFMLKSTPGAGTTVTLVMWAPGL